MDFNLCHSAERCAAMLPTSAMDAPRYHLPEEEIGLGELPARMTDASCNPAAQDWHAQYLSEASWYARPAYLS